MVRRRGGPDSSGKAVVYWMQRAQRALDNPALDLAVEAANALHQPVVIFFAPVPYYPHANLRHYTFLSQGIPDIAERARKRGVGFVLRHYPDHHLPRFCDEVKASIVVGDENPLREPDYWRESQQEAQRSVLDGGCRCRRALRSCWRKSNTRRELPASDCKRSSSESCQPQKNLAPQVEWQKAEKPTRPSRRRIVRYHRRLEEAQSSVGSGRSGFRGGKRGEALKLLHDFVTRNGSRIIPSVMASLRWMAGSRLSPYLHFGHISPNHGGAGGR